MLKKILPNQKDRLGKWTPNYEGPYMVKKAFSGGSLILMNMDGKDLYMWMTSTKLVCTSLTVSIHLTKLNAAYAREYMSCVPYAGVVGSLVYAMVCIKPDLAQAINIMNRHMGNLGKEHWQALKRIFKYLKGTTDIGLPTKERFLIEYAFTIDDSFVGWKATL